MATAWRSRAAPRNGSPVFAHPQRGRPTESRSPSYERPGRSPACRARASTSSTRRRERAARPRGRRRSPLVTGRRAARLREHPRPLRGDLLPRLRPERRDLRRGARRERSSSPHKEPRGRPVALVVAGRHADRVLLGSLGSTAARIRAVRHGRGRVERPPPDDYKSGSATRTGAQRAPEQPSAQRSKSPSSVPAGTPPVQGRRLTPTGARGFLRSGKQKGIRVSDGAGKGMAGGTSSA